nr:aminotransferase class III-fold pyridoxal phosphate-dependent enzyme [Bacteroidota bacterium]
HAVISIGHTHPHYVQKISDQLNKIAFYSNSVQIPLQLDLAEKLGVQSGCEAYDLFLINSGAEAIENALKLASFHTRRKKIITFNKSFHGRTSLAVAVTDGASMQAPVNKNENILFLPLNEEEALEKHLNEEVAAVIVEGIQGLAGVNIPSEAFLKKIRSLCTEKGAMMILDEVQSGYGRSGKFFAFQYFDVNPDIITVAKGMGNGFPIAGVLISPEIPAVHGMLGTTFGGNHLACAAGIAVLEVMEQENLVENARIMGDYLMGELKGFDKIKEVRGKGLMIGIEFDVPCAVIRNTLLKEHNIFTGSSSNKNTMRILPALNVKKENFDQFLGAFHQVLNAVPAL